MGIPIDDRTPAFEAWLGNRLDALAPGIGTEGGQSFRVLYENGRRGTAHQMTAPQAGSSYLTEGHEQQFLYLGTCDRSVKFRASTRLR
jgi:hypothetical protein